MHTFESFEEGPRRRNVQMGLMQHLLVMSSSGQLLLNYCNLYARMKPVAFNVIPFSDCH